MPELSDFKIRVQKSSLFDPEHNLNLRFYPLKSDPQKNQAKSMVLGSVSNVSGGRRKQNFTLSRKNARASRFLVGALGLILRKDL